MYIACFVELTGVQSMKRADIKRRPLADTVLATLEPELKEYRELDGDGLYFRVKPDGKKANGHGLGLALILNYQVKV